MTRWFAQPDPPRDADIGDVWEQTDEQEIAVGDAEDADEGGWWHREWPVWMGLGIVAGLLLVSLLLLALFFWLVGMVLL